MNRLVYGHHHYLIIVYGVIGLAVNGLIFILFPYLWLVPVARLFFRNEAANYLGIIPAVCLVLSALIFFSVPFLAAKNFHSYGFLMGLVWGFLNFLIAMQMDYLHNMILAGQSGQESYTAASSQLFFSTFAVTLFLPAFIGLLSEQSPFGSKMNRTLQAK